MRTFHYQHFAVGLLLSCLTLPARTAGNMGLQLESRMVLMSGCAITSGEQASTSDQPPRGVQIVCSPDASSLAVGVNGASGARAGDGASLASSPVRFQAMHYIAPPGYHHAAWAEPRISVANFGMQLSGMGAVISLPASDWRMTRTLGATWGGDAEPESLEITLSW